MLEIVSNDRKIWALQSIIAAAHDKLQQAHGTNSLSAQSALDILELVKDASEKIDHFRWINNKALVNGVEIYITAINNS